MSTPLSRRLLLPLAAIIVVALVGASVLGVGYVRRSFPQLEGELELAGLGAEVEVVRDELGIPQIYADTPEDLFRAQGYVAAQDRFFQMDLRRHVTAGRLSELVGESGVETDKVIRTMGWRRVAQAELPLLSPEARGYLQAYAAGVNAYLEANPSPSQVALEYAVLAQSAPGYQIEPWNEVDSLAWLKAMAWDLRGNYEDELARARLAGSISLNQLTSLYPAYPFEEHEPILSPDEWEPPPPDPDEQDETRGGHRESDEPVADRVPADRAVADTMAALDAVPSLLGQGEGVGSNSWVVSGEHTDTGKPMLANDPHLGVTQPGIWSQAGLHCRDVGKDCPFDVTGFTFAGFPGVIIGHNQSIAWGFTNLDPDVTDFYYEDVQGDSYLVDGTRQPVKERTETIEVAGEDDVEITVRSTRHGPIMSDAIDAVADAGENVPVQGVQSSEDYDVSMAWTGLEQTRTAEAVFKLNTATDWEGFRDAARLFAVPSQNLVYADTEGNIGYQAPGLVPRRETSNNGQPPGYLPAPGDNTAYDWKGWVPFSQLPSTFNPDDGMIVTANQAVAEASEPFLTTEWDKGYRSQRITDLLRQQMDAGPLTTEWMRRIQNDTYNSFGSALVPALLEVDVGDEEYFTEPQQLLDDWDRSAGAGDGEQGAATLYFYAVWSHLLDLTLDDELPEDLRASGNSRWMLMVEDLLERPEDPWWDDQGTPGVVETRDEVLRQALIDARQSLTRGLSKDIDDWEWGRMHQLTLRHEVLGNDPVPGLVQAMVNEGPYPMPGGSSLVNANSWDAADPDTPFAVTSAPSMRMVVDLADLDDSRWVNQTGTSGHPFHPNWDDQTPSWVRGQDYSWAFSRESVEEDAEHTLRLTPAP